MVLLSNWVGGGGCAESFLLPLWRLGRGLFATLTRGSQQTSVELFRLLTWNSSQSSVLGVRFTHRESYSLSTTRVGNMYDMLCMCMYGWFHGFLNIVELT